MIKHRFFTAAGSFGKAKRANPFRSWPFVSRKNRRVNGKTSESQETPRHKQRHAEADYSKKPAARLDATAGYGLLALISLYLTWATVIAPAAKLGINGVNPLLVAILLIYMLGAWAYIQSRKAGGRFLGALMYFSLPFTAYFMLVTLSFI
ncbi:MAG: hypothetical protein JXR97_13720 [Planctomycetes bacterium]|nr:hypothetical protein [Planctomycetota bacterium]